MKLPLSTTCLIVGFIGIFIGVLMNLQYLKNKAKIANLIFDAKQSFLSDWMLTAINVLIIFVLWLCLPYRAGKLAEIADLYVIACFCITGIMGTKLLFPLLSQVNKKFNSAIDYKTNIADQVNGTLGTPTPAADPKKP